MKFIDAEVAIAADDDGAATPRPARPERRRVSVSLLLTLGVLVSTVVGVYTLLPERHDLQRTETVRLHLAPSAWDLTSPSVAEARAWLIGALGAGAPWPDDADPIVAVIGAKVETLLQRPAAILRVRRTGGGEHTLLVQQAPGIAPRRSGQQDGVWVRASRRGRWVVIDATAPVAGATQRP